MFLFWVRFIGRFWSDHVWRVPGDHPRPAKRRCRSGTSGVIWTSATNASRPWFT